MLSLIDEQRLERVPKSTTMCYFILTIYTLVWFLLSLVADLLVFAAMVTPRWLIGPSLQLPMERHTTVLEDEVLLRVEPRFPSVGIYTRCRLMRDQSFQCNAFDSDGFATNEEIYPNEWKAAMFFIALGFSVLTITVALTLITCCRQSFFGKSLHNMIACAQVIAGICVIFALFLHPLGWGAQRVQWLCGSDASPFYPGACNIGVSLFSAVAGALLCFCCAGISLKAESSNMRSRVKRRIESGDRIVCIP